MPSSINGVPLDPPMKAYPGDSTSGMKGQGAFGCTGPFMCPEEIKG